MLDTVESQKSVGLSLIIPTMNRYESLKKTIHGIAMSSILPDQIIIIDQTKDESLAQKNKSLLDDFEIEVKYIKNEIPSLTKARNTGMEYAKNEIVIHMDDDVDIKVDTFKHIKEIMVDDKIALIAGTDERYRIGHNMAGYLFAKKSLFKRKNGYVTQSIYGRFPHVDYLQTNTEWAMGFFFVIRKSLHDQWKMQWDENLKGYAFAEDLDYSYRYFRHAKVYDLKCILTKKVLVRHNVASEWRMDSRELTYMKIMNREYLRHKLFNNHISFLLITWNNFGEIIKRFLGKENYKDYIEAVICCNKNRKDIRNAVFYYKGNHGNRIE